MMVIILTNLLQETIDLLKAYDKDENDIKWCGATNFGYCTFEHFKSIANIEYDSGFGGQEIANDIIIVGDDFWLERHEYDGSEWWEYKTIPVKPIENINFKLCGCSNHCWEELKEINN